MPPSNIDEPPDDGDADPTNADPSPDDGDAAPVQGDPPDGDDAGHKVVLVPPSAEEMALAVQDESHCTWDRRDGVVVFEEKNGAALNTALRILKVDFRFNVRALRNEWSRDGGQTWEAMTDRSTAALQEVIAATFRYKVFRGHSPLYYGRESWNRASNALLYGRECDPFKDWLKVRPKWEETKRLDSWLGEVFTLGDPDDPLVPWACRYMFLGPVVRAHRPGAKLDEMPVLIGPPGIGKSTAVEWVLPRECPEWFTNGLNLAAPDKVRVEALQGRVMVEVAEMAGATRAEIEGLKAFLSRTDDGVVRRAYRANPDPSPRRGIFVGTADHQEALPNGPNLRRFVPVTLAGGDPAWVREYLDEHREQLWAEALSLYKEGAEARLPDHLKPRQAEATAAARQRDAILEDKVVAWAAQQMEPFTLAQCAAGIGLPSAGEEAQLSRAAASRLGQVLRHLGYEKTRGPRFADGSRPWLWERKR